MKTIFFKRFIPILIVVLVFAWGMSDTKSVFAQNSQESESILYVPLIGITSVPEPLSLPLRPGNVTYHYAVKNFLPEEALTDIQVVDDKCSPVKFIEGDDNDNSKLDSSETWRYTCITKISETTKSTAIATGRVNNITATHKAYATVVVGSNISPPLVSIIYTTKVVYPLTLPPEGGDITFTYKVNNPGVVPLSNLTVSDDKCSAMSNKLGDTNANNLLDINEVWNYACTTFLTQTTTSTATVTAYANGLKAVGDATLTVTVDTPIDSSSNLFDVGISPVVGVDSNFKIIVWGILAAILLVLIVFFFLNQRNKLRVKNNGDEKQI